MECLLGPVITLVFFLVVLHHEFIDNTWRAILTYIHNLEDAPLVLSIAVLVPIWLVAAIYTVIFAVTY